MKTTLISDCLILPMTAEGSDPKYFKGSVAIRGNRIVMVTADRHAADALRDANPGLREIDGRGKLLMPGLVNTHCHAAMTLMRNFADDIALMPWLNDSVWPFESKLGAAEIATGAKLGIAEMLLGGTTTFADMYWHEAAIGQAAREMGIRAVLCPSFVDGERMEEFERDLPETVRVAESCERLSVRIAPHSAYSCSEKNLRRAVELAHLYGIGIHTHVSETRAEQQIVLERRGTTPTQYLDSLGLFDVPALAAHCVYVTDADMDILARKEVTAVHNPQSNMKLASGTAPVPRMIERGVNVTVATDGPSSNNDLDMWDEMRTASFLQKLASGDPSTLPAYEILKMGTVNGARALGMEGQLGVIAEGALADMVMLDLDKPRFHPHNDLVAGIVYCACAADTDTVFVDGEMVVREGKLTGFDIEGLYGEVERTVAAIKKEL